VGQRQKKWFDLLRDLYFNVQHKQQRNHSILSLFSENVPKLTIEFKRKWVKSNSADLTDFHYLHFSNNCMHRIQKSYAEKSLSTAFLNP